MKPMIDWRLVTALLVSASVAACGGDGLDGGVAATSRIPIGGESGTELADVQVLHWGNAADAQSLDPHKSEGVSSSNIQRDLFEGLITEAPAGEVIPGAAESWEISEDGRIYTFTLRRNARWSNGDPVVADDFAYGLRRSLDPATLSRYTFILHPILNARAVAAGQRPITDLGVRVRDVVWVNACAMS